MSSNAPKLQQSEVTSIKVCLNIFTLERISLHIIATPTSFLGPPAKKQKTELGFSVYLCPWARRPTESKCRAVLCNACFESNSGIGESANDTGRRKSRRTMNKALQEDDPNTHKCQDSQCRHSYMPDFQICYDDTYFRSRYQKKNPNEALDLNCLQCGQRVYVDK